MATDGQIIKELRDFIRLTIATAFVGEVVSVDKAETEGTVEVLFNGIKRDVRLKSVSDDATAEMLQIPDIKSYVFCVPELGSEESYIVVKQSKVAKTIYKGDNINYNVSDEDDTISLAVNSLIINDGTFGALIKIDELTTKLNGLVTEVNALKDKYNAHVNVIPAGTVLVAATAGVLNPAAIPLSIPVTDEGSSATSFDANDYKNEKITHG